MRDRSPGASLGLPSQIREQIPLKSVPIDVALAGRLPESDLQIVGRSSLGSCPRAMERPDARN